MNDIIRLPARSQVKADNTWDLSPLCKDETEWEQLLLELDGKIAGLANFAVS